jgi:predicted methyltransferase
MLRLTAVIAAALVASTPAAASARAQPETASAAPARSADNVELDSSRKPTEVLKFLGLKPGMHVLDLFGGNRYWAEIMAPVVGASGHDTVWEPAQGLSDKDKAGFAAFAATHPNASLIVSPMEAPDLPASSFDLAILNLNYHDLYVDHSSRGEPLIEPREWVKRLYAAMKPGGVVGVIDHIASASDDTRAMAGSLHRIDPDVVKADFESAGFVLDGTSDVLRNPADDHSLKVFDPALRGKTDRFLFRFVKPAK